MSTVLVLMCKCGRTLTYYSTSKAGLKVHGWAARSDATAVAGLGQLPPVVLIAGIKVSAEKPKVTMDADHSCFTPSCLLTEAASKTHTRITAHTHPCNNMTLGMSPEKLQVTSKRLACSPSAGQICTCKGRKPRRQSSFGMASQATLNSARLK